MKKINNTRKIISNLVDCKVNEIIFTSGTTDGINKISRTLDYLINKDDEIIISKYNHSSNAVP
jgi:cysteine desulfurase/selenocysteine lyase